MLEKAWSGDEFLGVEGVFTFPIWPMRLVVLVGGVLATVQYALLAAQDWSESSRSAKAAGVTDV